MKKKILVTCFEPYGLKGLIFKRNESKEIALRLNKEYGFEIIVLPVKDLCIQRLINKLEEYKPTMVICFGQSDNGFRIESICSREDEILCSVFAQDIKKHLEGFVKDNIGNSYCNDVYYETLSRVPKTIFIHVPIYIKFSKVNRIIKFIIKHEKLSSSLKAD